MANNNNEVTYTLLHSMRYLKDNRILPTGFDKNSAPNDVAVQDNARNDNNFFGGSDQISYRLSGLSDDSYSVKAEFLYQTIAYAFAQDLFKESTAEITDFELMYDKSNFKAVSIQFDVQ